MLLRKDADALFLLRNHEVEIMDELGGHVFQRSALGLRADAFFGGGGGVLIHGEWVRGAGD